MAAQRAPPKRLRDAETLTDIGCPDCSGVLVLRDEGEGLITYRCRVGHFFTDETLVPFKEEQLERAMWTAIELAECVGRLHVARVRRGAVRGAVARAHRERAGMAVSLAVALRALFAEDRVVSKDASARVGKRRGE